MVKKDHKKLFSCIELPEPSEGLFDRIIHAIKREQEIRNTKRLVFGFLILLIISFSTAPFSWIFFSGQMAKSGIFQFISIAVNNFETFLVLWPDFIMAIIESLPIMGIIIFTINLIIAVFTLRLFLYKKKLLVGYLLYNI